MIQKIVDGISEALYQEFGEEYAIYTEGVQQGLEKPCFFITPQTPRSDLFLGKRYFRRNPFQIQFVPQEDEADYSALERLFICLEVIEVAGEWARGTKMNYEETDEGTTFYVSYDMFLYRMDGVEKMQDYRVEMRS